LAGGGIRGDQVYGRTVAIAGAVNDCPVRPDDLAATLYEALGIPADTILTDSFSVCGQERKQLPQLLLVRLASIFADLECLDELDLGRCLGAVRLGELIAESDGQGPVSGGKILVHPESAYQLG